MALFSLLDYRLFKENPYLILFLYFLCFLALVGLFLFAPSIRGVRSWYRIGGISIDPAEFSKLILIIILAKYFSLRHREMYKMRHLILSGLYMFLFAASVYFQPDLGSALIFFFIWFGIILVSGIHFRHFLLLILIAIIIGGLAWNFLLKDYQKERIIGFLSPEYDPLGSGWNQKQAKIAIGSGGFSGRGFGNGPQTQHGFLPETQTDFIFSSIGEEFGFLGLFLLLFAFFVLLWRLTKNALFAKDNFSRLFILGLVIWIFIQLIINIFSNIGFLPVIGIPLPLVSYGGSSIISLFVALGIFQSIKKNLVS